MNPMLRHGEVEFHQRELMQQAENARLARIARQHPHSPLLAVVGRQMVVLGWRLQERTRPVAEQHYEPHVALR